MADGCVLFCSLSYILICWAHGHSPPCGLPCYDTLSSPSSDAWMVWVGLEVVKNHLRTDVCCLLARWIIHAQGHFHTNSLLDKLPLLRGTCMPSFHSENHLHAELLAFHLLAQRITHLLYIFFIQWQGVHSTA